MLEILFFSRGKGRGHAVPDAAIVNELVKLEPSISVTFISYDTGAATLRQLGQQVIDLGLPEDSPVWDTIARSLPILQSYRPTLIVSHEEFGVVPVAKILGSRVLFLTDWFVSPESLLMQALKYADHIAFLDNPGIYDEPPYLAGKVSYLGCVLRPLDLEMQEKSRCRTILGIPENSTVILVAPGGAGIHSEKNAPIFDVLLGAYDMLEVRDKRLVWIASELDCDLIMAKSANRGDMIIMKPHTNFGSTLVAADLVITKGNRVSVFECEALNIPSISISHGNNIIDDYRVSHIRTNIALRAGGLTALILRDYLLKALELPLPKQDTVVRSTNNRFAVAKLVHTYLIKKVI